MVRGPASYSRFRRVLAALSRQPEYRATGGALAWSGLRLAGPLIYLLRVRPTRPLLVTVERAGEVLASLTFTRSGQIANAVVLGQEFERLTALRYLQAAVDQELDGADRPLSARTFATNRSWIAALRRRRFVQAPGDEYVVTVPLGPLTFSWFQKRPARWPGLVSRRLVRFERAAGASRPQRAPAAEQVRP